MSEKRCERTDLLESDCAHCRGFEMAAEFVSEGTVGKPFVASYPGRCAACEERFNAGEQIISNGQGSYLCEECHVDTPLWKGP